MKTLTSFTFFLLFTCIGYHTYAQTTIFSEDFETIPIQFTSYATQGTSNWGINTSVQSSGLQGDSAHLVANDTIVLESEIFSTLGKRFVQLTFDHICYISSFNSGQIDVSNDGGKTWHNVSSADYYDGPSPTYGGAVWVNPNTNKGFNNSSYPLFWSSSNLLPFGNTWLKNETLNLTPFVGFSTGGTDYVSDSCKIRFRLVGKTSPSSIRHTWYIDDIKIWADTCDWIHPLSGPTSSNVADNGMYYGNSPSVYYWFEDKHSGMDTAYMYYSVNSSAWDSIGMLPTQDTTFSGATIWEGTIPFSYNGIDTLTTGDTVSYYVKGFDKSPCSNSVRIPEVNGSDSSYTFYMVTGRALPFCDDFEGTDDWLDSTKSTPAITVWERGNTLPVGTYAPHSGSNAWVTKVNSIYPSGAEAYLYSPHFTFKNLPHQQLSFYQRRDLPFSGDYLSLEYSIDGAAFTNLGVHNDVNGMNPNNPHCDVSTWYTNVGSGGLNTSWNDATNDWVYSYYRLPDSLSNGNLVQFRFKFQSDLNVSAYGVAIDDFCIESIPSSDISLNHILWPGTHAEHQLHFIKQEGELDSVAVIVQNWGLDTIKNIHLGYEVRNDLGTIGSIVSELYDYSFSNNHPHGLPPNTQDTIRFKTKYTVPHGNYTIFAFNQGVVDMNLANDSIYSAGHFGFQTDTLALHESYFNNFDQAERQWAAPTRKQNPCETESVFHNKWERGQPNWASTNNSYSQPNSWDINLDTNYTINSNSFLYTQFFDLSSAKDVRLGFWYNLNTLSGKDGFNVEFRTDPSNTNWYPLHSTYGTLTEVNWYSKTLMANGLIGMSGNSNGWTYAEFAVDSSYHPFPTGSAANKIQFRFRFVSDGTTNPTDDGVSIDDFRLFSPRLYDAELDAILLPSNGCGKQSKEKFKVRIKNNGTTALDSIVLCYEATYLSPPPVINSGINCDTIFQPLPLAGIIEYEPTHLLNLSAIGDYSIDAWISHSLDSNKLNDSLLNQQVTHSEGCKILLSIITGNTVQAGSEIMIIDTLNNDTLFRRALSSIGVNSGLWQEYVCLSPSGEFKLISKRLAPGNLSQIILRDLYADTTVWATTNPNSNFERPFSWDCGPQLNVAPIAANITGTSTILPLPQVFDIATTIENRGLQYLDTTVVTLEIRQIAPTPSIVLTHTDTISFVPELPTFAKDTHLFSGLWNANPGSYEIIIWTSEPNLDVDAVPADDTLKINFTVTDTILSLNTPYCNNFDGSTLLPWGVYNDSTFQPGTGFELGTPAQTTISTASSAPNTWMTGLATDYNNDVFTALHSPIFQVDDTASCYKVSFTHQFLTEELYDGGTLEYSTDSGKTWLTIGVVLDSLSATNWFNSPYVRGLGGSPAPAGWSGNSGGYITSSHDMHFGAIGKASLSIVFRFRFGSDYSIVSEGWAIDDFCFEKGGSCIFASCSDGILNQDETDVDCGGVCPACPSCFDGIQNGDETGVDCGGTNCLPCPTCSDGIQNGDETDVDCGGLSCPPCPTCQDGIMNGRETGPDCGGPDCPPCWVGIETLDPNRFMVGQNIPNPATNQTRIPFNLPKAGMVEVVIENSIGQRIHESTAQYSRGLHTLEINLANWENGIYYYSVRYNGKRITMKMSVNE